MRATSPASEPDLVAAEVQRLFDGIEGRPVSERASLKNRIAGELARVRSLVLEGSQRAEPTHPEFEVLDEDRYRLTHPGLGIAFTLDHVRRERHQLVGELSVTYTHAGAKTVDGVLSIGDYNVSSVQARSTRGKYLSALAQTKDEVDWTALLEGLSQRVLAAERLGQPAVLLHELERPAPDESLSIDGIPLLSRHPLIFFGDGGTTKSYLALYLAGMLALRGKRVLFLDWELDGSDHRERLERLFGPDMPHIRYKRCARPLFNIVESVRRDVQDHDINHVFSDSIVFACDGPPTDAEVAGRYFAAVRQLGPVGSVHLAHVTKSTEGAELRPFGSTFFHNGARSTWNVQLAAGSPGEDMVAIAMHNRKANLGKRSPSIGFEVLFRPERTVFRRIDPAQVPELATGLSVLQRIKSIVRTSPSTKEQLAAELEDVDADTFKRTLNRALKSGTLVRFPSTSGDAKERIGLCLQGEP